MATRAPIHKQPSNILQIGHLGWEAAPEQIIAIVDEFRSGYECPKCLDKEHRVVRGGETGRTESVVQCDNCSGQGHYMKGENKIHCGHCEGTGKIPCPACGGKGSETIVMSEESKDAPTTGVIASVGSSIKLYQLGQRVCFTSYSGHQFDVKSEQDGKAIMKTIRIMVERDVLAIVHGELAKKDIRRSMALGTNA